MNVRIPSRKHEVVEQLQSESKDAVYLDLDDPRTFALALAGVDRVFLLTGYTVAMLTQSKTLVNAAKKAGVNYYPQRDGRIAAVENGQVESLWVQEQFGHPICPGSTRGLPLLERHQGQH